MKSISNSIALGLLIIATASCKKYNNSPSTPQAPQKEITLQSNVTLGNYLVDKQNRTLYYFSDDPDGQDHCTGACELEWPVFNVDNLTADKLGDGLDITDFGRITAPNGSSQVTYKGWPLYHYAPVINGTNQQEAPGQTLGEGVDNIWFVAKPDYSIMLVNDQLLGQDGKNYKSDYTEGIGITTYFTDGSGLTLYTFKADSLNKNKFTKSDFSNNSAWPIYETNKAVVPSILDKSKFGSINVFGRTQLTYNGWPLYYFGLDGQTRGSNKGISFPSPGRFPVPFVNISQAPN